MAKNYKIKVRFTFTGTVSVKAKSMADAKEMVDKHFGGFDMKFHSVLPEEIIDDWKFPVHPEKKIISISS